MSDDRTVGELLVEIRDNQVLALENQQQQIALARAQLERAQNQIEESIALQRAAVERQRMAIRIGIPAIVVCLTTILYLVLRYF